MDAATQIPGPYILNETSTEIQVRGRWGKIVRRYPLTAQGRACADYDARRLQAGYTTEQKRVRDAAPAMLDALRQLSDYAGKVDPDSEFGRVVIAARSAIAKATA